MSNKALDFLKTTDWEYKEVTGEQYNVKKCPICGDERDKFYMSFEGLWDCKICGAVGNLYQLKAKIGGLDNITSINKLFVNKKELDFSLLEEYEEDLKSNEDAYEYLKEKRKFDDKTIKHFRLGSDGDWIVIPHIQENKLWNLKMRNFREKEFKRVAGQPSVLFNYDNLNPKKKTLVIVEGETDCIATWQLGVQNVIGLTVGAGTFLPEWIPLVMKYEEIIICLNSDAPGQKGAKNIAEKLGITKCKNVILPTKDVNDFLIEREPKEFIQLLKDAEQFNVQNITTLNEYIENIDEWFDKDGALNGLSLPFEKINSILKGFKEEDLIIVTGDSGIGKTTFTLNILKHFIQNNKRCLGFFLEGKIMYYILRMMSMERGVKVEELKDDIEKWEDIKNDFSDYPLYLYSGMQADLNADKLLKLLPIVVKAYNIEYIVIDHLQKIVKEGKDDVQEYSRTVSSLKDMAVDLKIPILLVVHVKKLNNKKRIGMHDAKSSSSIYQEADAMLAIWNKNNDDSEEDVYVTILKNRMGEGNIDIRMIREGENGIFRERIENIDKEPLRKKKQEIVKKEKSLNIDIDDTID